VTTSPYQPKVADATTSCDPETGRFHRHELHVFDARKVWHNAGIRGTLHTMSAPLRWMRRGDRSQPLDRNHLP